MPPSGEGGAYRLLLSTINDHLKCGNNHCHDINFKLSEYLFIRLFNHEQVV